MIGTFLGMMAILISMVPVLAVALAIDKKRIRDQKR